MRRIEYACLKPGDLVRHKHSGSAMTVVEVVGGVPVVARHSTICNPAEWDQVDPNGRVISND